MPKRMYSTSGGFWPQAAIVQYLQLHTRQFRCSGAVCFAVVGSPLVVPPSTGPLLALPLHCDSHCSTALHCCIALASLVYRSHRCTLHHYHHHCRLSRPGDKSTSQEDVASLYYPRAESVIEICTSHSTIYSYPNDYSPSIYTLHLRNSHRINHHHLLLDSHSRSIHRSSSLHYTILIFAYVHNRPTFTVYRRLNALRSIFSHAAKTIKRHWKKPLWLFPYSLCTP